jgi:hypothetical protein
MIKQFAGRKWCKESRRCDQEDLLEWIESEEGERERRAAEQGADPVLSIGGVGRRCAKKAGSDNGKEKRRSKGRRWWRR